MRLISTLFILFTTVLLKAQYNKKVKTPLPQKPRFAQNGWLFSPGLTWGNVNPLKVTENINLTPDTMLNWQATKAGKLGVYVEVGRYKVTDRLYFFNYIDYGLNYTLIRGTENFTTYQEANNQSFFETSGKNNFTQHTVGLFFNGSHVKPISTKLFIQNSFGLQANFNFIQNITANYYLPNQSFNTPPNLVALLNYKLGLGFKPTNYLLIIPSIQANILNSFPWDNFNFTTKYFESRFMPLVFSVRFMILQLYRVKGCPPVDAIIPEGYEPQ